MYRLQIHGLAFVAATSACLQFLTKIWEPLGKKTAKALFRGQVLFRDNSMIKLETELNFYFVLQDFCQLGGSLQLLLMIYLNATKVGK